MFLEFRNMMHVSRIQKYDACFAKKKDNSTLKNQFIIINNWFAIRKKLKVFE